MVGAITTIVISIIQGGTGLTQGEETMVAVVVAGVEDSPGEVVAAEMDHGTAMHFEGCPTVCVTTR